MSETNKPEVETFARIPEGNVKNLTYSIEGIPRVTESQTVNINLYSGSYLGQEKIVKTFQSPSVVTVVTNRDQSPCKEEGSKTLHPVGKESESVDEFYLSYPKNSCHSVSNELEVEKSMEIRKPFSDLHKQNGCTRNISDIDRRRLEAELKATEEIAKIKQSVVEKRLALELAYLDNAGIQSKVTKSQQQQQQQQQIEDVRALEEIALRKQSAIENSLAHELEVLDHQNRIQNAKRQAPQIPTANMRVISLMNSQGQEVQHTDILPPMGYRMDPNYMTMDNRGMQQSDSKKFNLSLRSPIPLETKKSTLPNAPNSTTDARFLQETRFMPVNEPIVNYQQPVQPMYIPNVVNVAKPLNFWKSTFNKVKNKLKPPKVTQPPWE